MIIYREFFQDAKVALRNIGYYMWQAIKHIAKYLAFCAAVLAIALAVGACITKWPLYSGIALVLGAIVTLFVIELQTVRWIRENEAVQKL
jgi:membrane protein YdbS with pleckstrin-like domain